MTGVQCLKLLHCLTVGHQHDLWEALVEAEGTQLPEVKVETVPLRCPECGEIHTGDEWERTSGACPDRISAGRS